MAKHPNQALFESRCPEEDIVFGLDEVGRGAWAGPLSVAVCACRGDRDADPGGLPQGLNDSKRIPESRRDSVAETVMRWCIGWAVGSASSWECDLHGMARALELASRRAIQELEYTLGYQIKHVLVDGAVDITRSGLGVPIVRGDETVPAIMAASVLAKVTRDQEMRELAHHFPQYDFEHNKGYGTWRHACAVAGYGPSAIHRRTWSYWGNTPWRKLAPELVSPWERDASSDQALDTDFAWCLMKEEC
jgi:ribonuclease HII